MNRAIEAITKVFGSWDKYGCPIAQVLVDCGKCPYIELPDEECEKVAQEEISRIVKKLNMEDAP